jgi:hypothetical protein
VWDTGELISRKWYVKYTCRFAQPGGKGWADERIPGTNIAECHVDPSQSYATKEACEAAGREKYPIQE